MDASQDTSNDVHQPITVKVVISCIQKVKHVAMAENSPEKVRNGAVANVNIDVFTGDVDVPCSSVARPSMRS